MTVQHLCLSPALLRTALQLHLLLAKVDEWGYDTLALEEATSSHSLSVLGFMLITRTEAFTKFRLDEGRLARWAWGRLAGTT